MKKRVETTIETTKASTFLFFFSSSLLEEYFIAALLLCRHELSIDLSCAGFCSRMLANLSHFFLKASLPMLPLEYHLLSTPIPSSDGHFSTRGKLEHRQIFSCSNPANDKSAYCYDQSFE
jgi:hypothetical protein